MKEKFMKEMMKKGKKMGEMSDMDMKASLKVLQDLSDQAGEAMGSKLTIKASSPEEAKEMLETAEDAVEGSMSDEDDMGSVEKAMKEYEGEDEEDEMEGYDKNEFEGSDKLEAKVADYSDLTMDEIEEQLERLQKLKNKKMESDSFGMA